MKKLAFVVGGACLLFLVGCQKELSGDFTTYTGHPLNDTIWVRNLPSGAQVHELVSLLAPDIIVDSFEVSKDTTLKYGDSLEVNFTVGCCTNPNGTAVTGGKARLEIYRLKKKGDFIKAFAATTSNNYPLETAGGFFVRVIKEGKELVMAPTGSIKIRFSDTEDPKPNMQVFNGKEGNPLPVSGIDTSFTWTRDTDTSWIKTFQKTGTGGLVKGYEMTIKNLRWTCAERFNDTAKNKTKIFAILPLNYTNKNTVVYAVYADQKTVVQLKADYASRSFAAPNIPLATKLKIVTISKIGDDMYLGTRDVNDVGSVVAYSISPEKKSLKDILQFLNTL